jgi:uncharacterized damage-inducible protein DinB
MPELALTDLLDYTEWERQKWLEWLRQRGGATLEMSAGAHGDGRFQRIGEVMRHIFSAEQRYVERLNGLPLTDTANVAADDIEALFQFGRQSRHALRTFIETLPAEEWTSMKEFKLLNSTVSATPRKIVVHVLLHEIRHWAQIATILRLNGMIGEFHDFLFSPVS